MRYECSTRFQSREKAFSSFVSPRPRAIMIHIPKEKIESCCFDGENRAERELLLKNGNSSSTQSFFAEKSILRANLEKEGFLLLITVFERNEKMSHDIVIEN